MPTQTPQQLANTVAATGQSPVGYQDSSAVPLGPNTQQMANAANPTPTAISTPSTSGLFRASGDFGTTLYNAKGQSINLLDPSLGLFTASNTGNAQQYAQQVVANLQSKYGLDYNSLPQVNIGDYIQSQNGLPDNVKTYVNGQARNPSGFSFTNNQNLTDYLGQPAAQLQSQMVNTQPALPASQSQVAASGAAQQQQLAGVQGQNVQTTTDAQGNITSTNATPLANTNPFAATGTAATSTPGATLDQLKQQLVQASGQLTQMQVAQETPASTANKMNSAFNSTSGTAPTSQGEAASKIQSLTGASTTAANPVIGSYASTLSPIMSAFTQILSNISNPSLTTSSLQSQYDQLSSQYGLPAMKTEMVNMQNIMNGTIDDVRNEITKAGGFATESQVQGIAAARNRTVLLQYNALANNYQAAVDNVNNMMQYASSDRSAQMQAEQLQASVVSSMASVQNQMTQMAMTMQNNARSAAQFNVSQMGYQALAQSIGNDPEMQSSYENLLGLAPGTLSDPAALSAMDTYKNQQLQINNYKAAITAYNAGYSGAAPYSAPTTTNSQYGTATSTVSQITGYDPNTTLSQINPATLASAMIKNEGSSPAGVVNNPGNIKYAGLPGQSNSGVQATDGGTFASYATPAAGQAAVTANIQNAIQSNPNQTLGAFVDRYTNTAPQNSPSAPVQGQVGITPVDPSTLVRPSFVANGIPLTMSAAQMEQYMSAQKSASVDPGTHNVVAPGVGYYLQQSDGSYVLKSALPSGIDQQYNEIKQTMANTQPESLSPTVTRKWSLTANAAISSFKNTGTYQVISNVAPYLANIRAAAANPGDKSVSDLELLDSYVRLSKGGIGQITGDQVDILLKGSSVADTASVLEQKLNSGGSLSTAQRTALIGLASSVYQENASDYKKIYVQAIQNMQGQGIPTQFWGNLPDFTSLMSQ